ncbi:hypothetical protein QTP88_018090 [Uroleucon formosanum]
MHLFLTLGLLMVCGMIDATFYNPRSQTFNQLMERRQRSIPLPYSYGYRYNPIEPSINVLDSLSEGLDSTVNTFKPIYQNVKISTHDVNSVPRTYSYQPKNSIYDSDYISVQEIPHLFPEEDSYDYKYLGPPLNKYLTQPSTQDSDIAINLVAIKKTSVFGYGFPTNKSPYSSDSVWNFGSKIPNTVFKDSLLVEPALHTVKIVKLFPETSEQESIITTTDKPKDTSHNRLLREGLNEVINSVKDELNYQTTQETSTEEESSSITTEETLAEYKSNPVTSEETQTGNESNDLMLKENSTEEESSFITTEEILTEDKSNSITTEGTQTGDDESNDLVLKENSTEEELSFITTEEILTEDKSNSITTEGTQTEDESNDLMLKENSTEEELSFITTEETLTEDKSNYITTEGTEIEDESNSIIFDSITTEDKLNYITTEENQKKDDESKSMSSQETTTAFQLNNGFNTKRYSFFDESYRSKLKNIIKNFRDQNYKSQFKTVQDIPAKFQPYFVSSEESTNQQFQPQLVDEPDSYEDYYK